MTSALPGRIARAATALFARQGYHGTTTREIARLADVSEVTVFRHFEHKEDLFLASLVSCFSGIQPRLDLFARDHEQLAPEEMLPKVMGLLVDLTTFSPELVRLVGVALLELHGEAEGVCYSRLEPLFTTIAGYLTHNIKNGKLRDLNPGIATAAIVLTAIAQPEISKLLRNTDFSHLGTRQATEEYSRFWLKVLLLPAQERAY